MKSHWHVGCFFFTTDEALSLFLCLGQKEERRKKKEERRKKKKKKKRELSMQCR